MLFRSDMDRTERFRSLLVPLARLEHLETTGVSEPQGEHATALAGTLTILVPMGSLIDRDAELARLKREITKLTVDLEKCRAKLANPDFVNRAPQEVVAKETARAEQLGRDLTELESRQERIAQMR